MKFIPKKCAICLKKGSHDRNISVILITQNLFQQGRYCRDISINAKYIVLLKNVRDENQFTHIARQVFPEDSVGMYKANLDATAKPQSYLLLDLSQDRRPTEVSIPRISGRRTTHNLYSSDWRHEWWNGPAITLYKSLNLQGLNCVQPSSQTVTGIC
jgi:hypothetical protein